MTTSAQHPSPLVSNDTQTAEVFETPAVSSSNAMTDLAIIIVSWNVRDLLAACLRSVQADLATSPLPAQVWVVDNASTDGSAEMVRQDFPTVQLIASSKNLGFAGGNNAALRAIGFSDNPQALLKPEAKLPSPFRGRARGGVSSPSRAETGGGLPSPFRGGVGGGVLPEAVFLLNPDTQVHPGALQTLFNFLRATPAAGIAGARLVYGNGTFQHGAFAFPGLWQLAIELLPLPGRLAESRLNGRYPHSLYHDNRPFPIGHPLGAAMCVRREAILQVGLMDESYHMYVEEIDWSKRIVSAGWQAFCVPAAVITHFEGQSTGQIKINSFINLWRSRYQFYRRYYSPHKLWLASQIVQLGMRRRERQDRQAAAQGQLGEAERLERLASYRHVSHIWQGREV